MQNKIKFTKAILVVGVLALLGLVVVFGIGEMRAANASPALSVQTMQVRPFGPGWAADYGTMLHAAVDPNTGMPFGPGWAADYGTTISYPILFGPEIAAAYGKHGVSANPFGPGWAATYGVTAR